MTAAALTPSVEYIEDGVTLLFPVPFRFLAATHLEVKRITAAGVVSTLAHGSAWSATGGTSDAGGTVTLVASVASAQIKIRRVTPRAQQTDYQTNDTFPAETHEAALDLLTLVDQEQDVKIEDTTERSVLAPEGEAGPALPSAADRIGKFLVGDAEGNLVPASGTGADAGLRTDLATTTGAALIGFLPSGTGAVARSQQAKNRDTVSVKDFGATGDGVTDDSVAFQAAVNAGRHLYIPPGKYLLGTTITLADGQHIHGAGKSAWEPYAGGAFPDVTRTEILVDGNLAFDAAGSNSAKISGLSIKAVGGTQSAFGAAAGKQASARGIDITGSTQFEARDVSFHGLEVAVDANQVDGSADTQMPRISDWMASDCGTVFRFGTPTATVYTVRDALISDSVIALHCDQMVDAHWCDGLRLENLRLFQTFGKSVYIRATPFVSMVGVTVFETLEDQVTLKDCTYVTISGALFARAGAYKAPPFVSKTALTMDGCTDVSFSGQIQQPVFKAIDIIGCTNVQINAAIGTPFWTFGNPTNASGSVNVVTSTAVCVNASFDGGGAWVNLFSDQASSRTLSGTISGDKASGAVRATHVQKQGSFIHTIPADVAIGAGGVLTGVAYIRAWLEAGQTLKARCVEITYPGAQLRTVVAAAAQLWTMTAEDGGGFSLEDKAMNDAAGAAGFQETEITLRNPTGATITVPRGTEIRISTAIV